MPKLGMSGPYKFTSNMIKSIFQSNKIGNYALGYVNSEGVFIVQYVGRSDNDVQNRVLQHLLKGERYQSFKACYTDSVYDAYAKECYNYHDFGGAKGRLVNKDHPAKPKGVNCLCPVCCK